VRPNGDGERAAIIPELSEDNPLVGLARQFGQARGGRAALRSAIGTPPNSKELATTTEPHLRGAILVSAVFDAFFTIYIKRTRDLMRIGNAGGAVSPNNDLHPELAARLAAEASKTAEHFVNICIRALDYCPPVDMQFGEFLRAIITADSDLVPDDPYGYRAEIIKAFRLRGIIPKKVKSYSEEALRWCPPEVTGKPVERCTGLEYSVLDEDDEEPDGEKDKRDSKNAAILNAFAKRNAVALGLDPKLKIQPFSFHPIHRISPNGKIVAEYVVEFLQMREEPFSAEVPEGPKITFRGGCTVIFNSKGEVRYVIEKSITKQSRLDNQRQFCLEGAARCACSPYMAPPVEMQVNFQATHRGY
jgi:hypothetical protein